MGHRAESVQVYEYEEFAVGSGPVVAYGAGGSGDVPALPTDRDGGDDPEEFFLHDIREDRYFADRVTGGLALKLDGLEDKLPGIHAWPNARVVETAPVVEPTNLVARFIIERIAGVRYIFPGLSSQ